MTAEDKQILQKIAQFKGISVAEYIKQCIMKEMRDVKREMAFELLKSGKIGRKRAFLLSGLSYNEFTVELNRRRIDELTSMEAFEKGLDLVRNLDISSVLRREIG